MNQHIYKFDAKLWRTPYSTAAYIIFPGDIKRMFGKGRVYIHAKVDDLRFDCCIVNAGHKHYKKRPTYTISINREKLLKLGKVWGDTVTVLLREREKDR